MRSRIVSVFSEALATSKVPVLDVATRYSELGEALLPLINPVLEGEVRPRDGELRPRERVGAAGSRSRRSTSASSMAAVGNLNDYVKYQMAQGFEKGGAGVGGVGAEMAVGMAMAQQMMNQPGGITAQATPAAGAAAAAAAIARNAQPGRRGESRSACQRSRRDREPRSRRSERQEDRHAVAHHARAARRVPAVAHASDPT